MAISAVPAKQHVCATDHKENRNADAQIESANSVLRALCSQHKSESLINEPEQAVLVGIHAGETHSDNDSVLVQPNHDDGRGLVAFWKRRAWTNEPAESNAADCR